MKTRIAELRKENGYTLKELGKILHVRDNALSQYETDNRNPQLGLLREIANFFGVSLDYLTYYSDKRDYPVDTEAECVSLLQKIQNNEIHYDGVSNKTALDLSLWVLRHNTLFLENGKYESLATTATSFIQTTASENKVLKLFTDQRVEENDALTKIENRIIFGDDNQDEPYYGPSPKVILEFMNEGERLGPQKTAEFIQRMKDTPTPSEYEE